MAVVVLDNGSWTQKVGLSTDAEPKIVPNLIAKAKHERKRVFVGEELGECTDKSGLFLVSPFERGFLVRWEQEHQLWDRLFPEDAAGGVAPGVATADTTLVCTEPPLNFPSCQETLNEVIFEDYGFAAAYRTTAASLAARRYRSEHPEALCVTVVDAGLSFTHVVPHCEATPLRDAISRINVGGKILTNHLKEVVSYRQLQVMEEAWVMNECKEDVCFVSRDFAKDMALAKAARTSPHRLDYVLPDFARHPRGFVRRPEAEAALREAAAAGDAEALRARQEEQVLRLNAERFTVPELLFRPSDVGIEEMGVAEATALAIGDRSPEELRSHLARHCVLVGGSAAFPGFRDRFHHELRTLLPDEYEVSGSSDGRGGSDGAGDRGSVAGGAAVPPGPPLRPRRRLRRLPRLPDRFHHELRTLLPDEYEVSGSSDGRGGSDGAGDRGSVAGGASVPPGPPLRPRRRLRRLPRLPRPLPP